MFTPRTEQSDVLNARAGSSPEKTSPLTVSAETSSSVTPDAASSPAADAEALRRVQLRRKAILAVVVFGFVGVAAVTRPLSEDTAWEGVLATAGLAAIFGAIVGRAWCSLYIGGRKTREIVMRGPYSISRNPLYVFSFLATFGVGAQTGSVILSIAAVLLTFAVLRQMVLREEAWLRAAFGAEYERYLRATPRFWPRWSAWNDEPRLEISPARFVTTVLDGSILFLVLPVMAALSIARAEDLIPVLLTLP